MNEGEVVDKVEQKSNITVHKTIWRQRYDCTAEMNGKTAAFWASHILCQDTFSSLVITTHPLHCV